MHILLLLLSHEHLQFKFKVFLLGFLQYLTINQITKVLKMCKIFIMSRPIWHSLSQQFGKVYLSQDGDWGIHTNVKTRQFFVLFIFSLEHNCTSCPNAAAHSNLHRRFSVKPKLINPESNKCIQNIELNVIYQLLVPTLHKLKV